MDYYITLIIFTLNVLVSNALAYIATHGRTVIPVKPFNCYGCLAFWLTLIIGTMLNYWLHGVPETFAVFEYIVVLGAFLNFLYVKSKYIITK